jgi:hypothetical protein
MESRITPELKSKIQSKVNSMILEDKAKGVSTSQKAKETYFENVASYYLGDSPRQNELFWKSGGSNEDRKSGHGLKALDAFVIQKSAYNYNPSTVKKRSFADVVSPFYGKNFNQEVGSARQYINSNLSKPVLRGPLRFADFSKFLSPNRVEEKIPVFTALNPDDPRPARANYNPRLDRIVMGEDFKYGSGKPIVLLTGENKKLTLPSIQATYNNVLNHEIGHSMFSAALGENMDKTGPDYYNTPNEMITELAHAQRQYYKMTGKRFDSKSFIDFMGKAKTDKKVLDGFAQDTKNALINLLNGSDNEVKTRIKQAAEVIPALVANEKAIGIRNALKA